MPGRPSPALREEPAAVPCPAAAPAGCSGAQGCGGGGLREGRGRRVPACQGAFLPVPAQADAHPAEAVKRGRAAARLADSCPVICQPQGDARAGRLRLTSHFHLRNKR